MLRRICLALGTVLLMMGEAYLVSAQDGREIQRAIRKTSVWNRPNATQKYLNPELEQSMKNVQRFTWEKRHLTRAPSRLTTNPGGSSRRYIPTRARDALDEQNGRRAQHLILNPLKRAGTPDNETGRKVYRVESGIRGNNPENEQLGRKAHELVHENLNYKRSAKQSSGSCYRSTYCSRDR